MTYHRVVPRDLFNEANLLKCLGHLVITLESPHLGEHHAQLDEGEGDPFQIEQDESDGSISVVNLAFTVNGQRLHLYRPLNSREPYPLWCRIGDDEVPVFRKVGLLTPEFRRLIKGKEFADAI